MSVSFDPILLTILFQSPSSEISNSSVFSLDRFKTTYNLVGCVNGFPYWLSQDKFFSIFLKMLKGLKTTQLKAGGGAWMVGLTEGVGNQN